MITGTLPVFNKTKSTNKVLRHMVLNFIWIHIEHVFYLHSTEDHVVGAKMLNKFSWDMHGKYSILC